MNHFTFSKEDYAKARRIPQDVRLVHVTVRDPDTQDVCSISTIMEPKHSNELLVFMLGHGVASNPDKS